MGAGCRIRVFSFPMVAVACFLLALVAGPVGDRLSHPGPGEALRQRKMQKGPLANQRAIETGSYCDIIFSEFLDLSIALSKA